MARQGLNREKLIEASISLMEEKGYNAFSMAELAKYVHVSPSSLYNHIESLDMLNTEVGLAAAERMVEAEKQAIAGKSQESGAGKGCGPHCGSDPAGSLQLWTEQRGSDALAACAEKRDARLYRP